MTDVEEKKRMFKVEKEIIVGIEHFLTYLKLISEIEQNQEVVDKNLLFKILVLKMFKEDPTKNMDSNVIKETIIDIFRYLIFLDIIVI